MILKLSVITLMAFSFQAHSAKCRTVSSGNSDAKETFPKAYKDSVKPGAATILLMSDSVAVYSIKTDGNLQVQKKRWEDTPYHLRRGKGPSDRRFVVSVELNGKTRADNSVYNYGIPQKREEGILALNRIIENPLNSHLAESNSHTSQLRLAILVAVDHFLTESSSHKEIPDEVIGNLVEFSFRGLVKDIRYDGRVRTMFQDLLQRLSIHLLSEAYVPYRLRNIFPSFRAKNPLEETQQLLILSQTLLGAGSEFIASEWESFRPLVEQWWELYLKLQTHDRFIYRYIRGTPLPYHPPIDLESIKEVLDRADELRGSRQRTNLLEDNSNN